MKLTVSSVIIGGGVNLAIIWILSKYSERLALYYAFLLLLVLTLAYWQQISASFNLTASLLRALTSANNKTTNHSSIKGK